MTAALGNAIDTELVTFEDGSEAITVRTYALTDAITLKLYNDDEAELSFGPFELSFRWTPVMQRLVADIDHYEAIELLSIFANEAEQTG